MFVLFLVSNSVCFLLGRIQMCQNGPHETLIVSLVSNVNDCGVETKEPAPNGLNFTNEALSSSIRAKT